MIRSLGSQPLKMRLGEYRESVFNALADVRDRNIVGRIWEHDHTVWKSNPKEITNRLGWLNGPEEMLESSARINAFASDIASDGITNFVLLGMGGSSLAPEVFAKTFLSDSDNVNGRHLVIIDGTDPDFISQRTAHLDLQTTLFVVATKSGGTVETLSAFKYFFNRVSETVGPDRAGSYFVAITDPGSGLLDLADRYSFRETFVNDPNIGGRYSVISHFGLVPAALIGVDIDRLLERAASAAANAAGSNCPVEGDNHAAVVGATIGELAKAGRDKLTFVISEEISSFGDWVEQLIAESTGKEGLGILPVVGETLADPAEYGPDRVFVGLTLPNDPSFDTLFDQLAKAGHPVIEFALNDKYDLGAQFFLWEMATAVASSRLSINPFDQPNVEAAKILAKKMVAKYLETAQLPTGQLQPMEGETLDSFLAPLKPGDYISIHAYVAPTPEVDRALANLQTALRRRHRCATTIGYGPRFLHSTGQLHKGDSGNGFFIQLVSEPEHDLPIPDKAGEDRSSMTFGVLKAAQAAGDARALANADRKVIRLWADANPADDVNSLARSIGGQEQ